ncbi:hypothetical protein FS842_005659 [Serendipita sp. 407]|nr:hypothetical protein FRC18_009898 [Serendipita sp. 400]KAG9054258.1 hypothetical protein FS842_005659 [Serendipita sp. 407]
MSTPIPYSDFQTPFNALAQDGGSWVVQQSAREVVCHSATNKGCFTQGCVTCTILNGAASSPSYTLRYIANVSVPMSQYGNANSLDYSFSYYLIWTSSEVAAGLLLSTKLTVGSSSNTDSFASVDHVWLWDSVNPVIGDPFSHTGTTSLLKSVDRNTAYIPIIIDFSFARQPGLCEWYLTAHAFNITTPTTGGISGFSTRAQASSPLSRSISSSATSTKTLPSELVQTTSPDDTLPGELPAVGIDLNTTLSNGTATDIPPNSRSVQDIPIATIIGGVVGGNFALGILLLSLFLLYKRRKRASGEESREELIRGAGGTDDDGNSTSMPVTIPGHRPRFIPIASPSSSEINHPRPSNDLSIMSRIMTTILPARAPLVDSQLQSDFQRGHATDHRILRYDLWQPSFLSPSTEVDAPPPAYVSNASDTTSAANEPGGQGWHQTKDRNVRSTAMTPVNDDILTVRARVSELK